MTSLVSVNWLKDHLNDPDLVLLFVFGLKFSREKLEEVSNPLQITGSRPFDLKNKFRDLNNPLPNTLPSPEQFGQNVQDLGVNKTSKVVLYDASGVYASPRAWYLFKAMGHEEVAVLNGGLPAWKKISDELEAFKPDYQGKGNFEANFQENRFYQTKDLIENLSKSEFEVIDARSSGRFNGTAPEPRAGLPSGHIPNSFNIPFSELIEEGHFKSPEKLKEVFQNTPLDDKPLVFSCGSGITACITFLAAEQISDQKKGVYDGSWTEWAQSENAPISDKGIF